ncbi:MAG TPA: hypothetical protein VEP71_00025 [Gallionella sp.]|nr:hypothetical protein [Gallionella sp.]
MGTDYQSAEAIDESPLPVKTTLRVNGGFATRLCLLAAIRVHPQLMADW